MSFCFRIVYHNVVAALLWRVSNRTLPDSS